MIKIQIDSRKCDKGDCYVAIRGNTVDGHDYIQDAINHGARTVVIDHDIKLPSTVYKIIVDNTEKWLEDSMIRSYSKDINKMNLIGITGTNGKTTTAYLTYQLLNRLGSKTAYIGTIGCYIPGMDPVELPNTTPNIRDLYDLLLTAKENGCTHISMEVSSQGLDMNRTVGLKFKTGLFTNLTQDHLDYHKTMDNYLNCKLKMLDQLEGNMIINNDDKYASIWKDKSPRNKTIGFKGEDIKIVSFEDELMGTRITIKYQGKEYEIHTNLKGEFNVYNYVSTLSIALDQGYTIEQIIEETKNIYPPKGRCEIVEVNDGIAVIDYAHTPDAMDKIIDTFNNVKRGRIITIFGCGGNRDATKRPKMASIATSKSDYCIITNDNPRCENEELIMKDILEGVKKDNYEVIYDRREAINKALNIMNENDIVLILGKGHEDYQIIGKTKHHFDDREVVEEYKKDNIKQLKRKVK